MGHEFRVASCLFTAGSPPFLHLQLAAATRYTPGVPIYVYDTGHADDRMEALCQQYGATYQRHPVATRHHHGTQWGIASCIRWAAANGFDFAFLRSRRYVPLFDWRADLAAVAARSPHPTYGSGSPREHLLLRSDCLAVRPTRWVQTGADTRLLYRIEDESRLIPCEAVCYWAARVAAGLPDKRRVEASPPFGEWPEVVTDHRAKPTHPDRPVLWRYYSQPQDYAAAARAMGLPYAADDFRVSCNC